jgi:hypothetical protein
MILHMDGFAQFNGLSASNLAIALANAGWVNPVPNVALQPGRIANSTALTFQQATAAAAPGVRRTINTNANMFWVGFAFKGTERAPIASIAGVKLDWHAGISVGSVNGTAIPARNVWYYYELEVDRANKKLNIYVNDSLDVSADLDPAIAAQTSYDLVLAPNGAYDATKATELRYTDFYTCDASSGINSRMHPMQITTRLPDADYVISGGSAPPVWSPSTGSDHYKMVNSLPADGSKYIQSGVSGAMDLFSSSAALPDGSQVLAVGLIAQAKKTDIDNRKLGMVFGGPGAQLEVVQPTLSTDWAMYYAFYDKAPGGGDWTLDDAENLPFGVVVRP